jgi:hypothetical protein
MPQMTQLLAFVHDVVHLPPSVSPASLLTPIMVPAHTHDVRQSASHPSPSLNHHLVTTILLPLLTRSPAACLPACRTVVAFYRTEDYPQLAAEQDRVGG